MIPQDDERMPEAFRRYGCRVRALLAIAEMDVGDELTAEQILDILDYGRGRKGVIVNDQYRAGRREHLLINRAFQALHVSRRGVQNGRIHYGDPYYWSGDDHDYILREYRTDGEYGLHWVLCSRDGDELFDPYDGEYTRGEVTSEMTYRTWAI